MDGHTDPRFASLGPVFEEILAAQGAGAALAVVHDGESVVDLWGGTVGEHGLVHTWSTIKPIAATSLLTALGRAGVPLETPVRDLWPELRAGAGGVLTVHGLLSHRSGVVTVPGGDVALFLDPDAAERALEQAEPDWAPGTAAGEHAITYGNLLAGVLRRVDGRSLGRFWAEELAAPLGLDVHVGVADADLHRVVDLEHATPEWYGSFAEGRPALLAAALGTGVDAALVNGRAWRQAEIPAVNGHVTARSLARFWWLAHTGALPAAVLAPPPAGPEPDLVLGRDVAWTAGSAQHEGDDIGMGGIGGSYGGLRRDLDVSWAFLTTAMGGFERIERLEAAIVGILT